MLRNFPAIGFCNYQNVNIPDEFYPNIKEAVIRFVECGNQVYKSLNENVRCPNPVSSSAKRSLKISKEALKSISYPKNLNVLSSRELYIEMRDQIVAQAELFLGHFAHDYYNPSVEGMNFNFFKQWLEMYPFVRSIVREMLMPRIWSLNIGCAVKQITLPIIPNEVSKLENTTNDVPRNSVSINRPSSISGTQLKFQNPRTNDSFTDIMAVSGVV